MNIFTTIAQTLQNKVAKTELHEARINAIRSAVTAANIQHPEFQGIGFDASLLLNQAKSVMAPFLNDGLLPDADELATLWATTWANGNQFASGAAQKAAANITPMVSDFIYVLETSDLPAETEASQSIARPQPARSEGYPSGAFLGMSS